MDVCYVRISMACHSVVLLFKYIENYCFLSPVNCITEGIVWLHHGKDYLIQNSQAVKKECGPPKGYGEKDVKSKVATKKWL